MDKYKLYVDAAADLPNEARERYQIGVLPIPVSVGDKTWQSGLELTNDDFYKLMEESRSIPVTSQITPYVFEELFKHELAEGTNDLIVILINARGSATYQNAISTRERFLAKNPQDENGMRIHLFDGASYSGGYGFTALLAAQKLEMGMPVKEVLAQIDAQLKKQRIYFGLYTLKYAGKSGRIPSAAVFVGETLGIKPIMRVWDHEISTAGKARGEKKLVREIAKMALADMEPNTPYGLIYGNDSAACDEMSEEMTKRIGYPPMYRFQVGAAVAINAGPRIVGVVLEMRKKKLIKGE
ncbi:MAG: DegV family protein [Clostridia bacterium]